MANKKMDAFSKESFRFGSVKGFRHFELEVRGKEELLLTVHQPPADSAQVPYTPRKTPQKKWDKGGIGRVMDDHVAGGLPPASPCANESQETDAAEKVVFLIGGYAHYGCPYVWVRSGHHKLQGLGDEAIEKDAPLALEATEQWKKRVVHIWEIIAELVGLAMAPMPQNPFAVDPAVAQAMPLPHRVLQTGAMAAFLREVYMSNLPCADAVEGDYLQMLNTHFSEMPLVARAAKTGQPLVGGGLEQSSSNFTMATAQASNTVRSLQF